MKKDLQGRVFDIQRFCIHDGPGIRTTVFLKGCPLHCPWCHNPEGQTFERSLSFLPQRCIGCGFCLEACERGVHRIENGAHVLDRSRCVLCGACVEGCYAQALEMVGKDMTTGEVLEEVMKDEAFYVTSKGGMTLSGGEPTQQIDFAEALLRMAKERTLHTCVETCGVAPRDSLERLIPWVDLFLYDYKETDPERHRELTGASREQVLDNLSFLDEKGKALWLRCPIIPGIQDREDHLDGIVQVALAHPGIEVVDLMVYNPLGESKVDRFGLSDETRVHGLSPNETFVDGWRKALEEKGICTRPK